MLVEARGGPLARRAFPNPAKGEVVIVLVYVAAVIIVAFCIAYAVTTLSGI